MKLIIDIPDDDFNFIKTVEFVMGARGSCKSIQNAVINAIRNGTPYNPSGDLISREALKKDLKQYFTDGVLDGVSAKLVFNQILHDIDNAPTVDLTDIYQEGHYDGHLEGYTKAINEKRPQGECEKCDYRKFTENFIDDVVDWMDRYGITSIEQLSEILKGGAE